MGLRLFLLILLTLWAVLNFGYLIPKPANLVYYVAGSYQTLGVKGTSITGFDTDKSVAKTLRKPEEQLKEFAKAGKVVLRTFIKDIKAVETKLNGRVSEDVLLLRVA